MGTDMQAASLGPTTVAGCIAEKPTVFKNTVVFVPVTGAVEGAYLAALLNSMWANYLLRASNVRGGKSAFATNVLQSIAIPKYNPRSSRAQELSRLGQEAAEQAAIDDERLEVTEVLIDEAAAAFWDIGRRQQEAMRASLEALG